jgi:excisionase family DNA binding protein
MDKNKDVLTVEDVAKQLDFEETTIRHYLRTGKLNGIKIGKEWRVLRTEFNDFINANRVRSVTAYLSLIRASSKEIWILGTNALGPLHQGREAIIKKLQMGVNVRVLLLNHNSRQFQKRVTKEDPNYGMETGRLLAEYQASFAICKDISFASKQALGLFEVRTYSRTPKDAMVIIDPDYETGCCNINRYPKKEGARGMTGGEIEIENKGKTEKLFKKCVSRYNALWNSDTHENLLKNKLF